MPFDHSIELERRRVTAVVTGRVAKEDFFTYQRAVWSRPEVAGFDELVDMTGAEQIEDATADAMRELAALSAEMDSDHPRRLAIVAPADLFFGLGRMYETYREIEGPTARETAVFRTRAEAEAWLANRNSD